MATLFLSQDLVVLLSNRIIINIFILGGTRPTSIALIRETLSRNHTVIVFALSLQMLPEDITKKLTIATV